MAKEKIKHHVTPEQGFKAKDYDIHTINGIRYAIFLTDSIPIPETHRVPSGQFTLRPNKYHIHQTIKKAYWKDKNGTWKEVKDAKLLEKIEIALEKSRLKMKSRVFKPRGTRRSI